MNYMVPPHYAGNMLPQLRKHAMAQCWYGYIHTRGIYVVLFLDYI